ncbi:MAG: ribosomal protein S18-alanine N-acetyltransferase, partial [Christensenellaceae bacterium]
AMTYRSWKFEDILKISELEKECFSDLWTYRMFVEGFSSKLFYGVCAVEDGEIVGYACETVLFENAEVDNIAVAESCRRRGVGKKLLKKLETEAKERGARVILLEVRVSNAPAMTMYLKEGFKGIYVRPRYYPDGEDAVVMQKEL